MRLNKDKIKTANALYMPGAMEALATVLEYGAMKYTPAQARSWLEYKDPETIESLIRHLTAHMNGEIHDKESGIPHIAHVLFNAACLCDRYHLAHGPGSFWLKLLEDSSASSSPHGTAVFCGPHVSHRLSEHDLISSAGLGYDFEQRDSSSVSQSLDKSDHADESDSGSDEQ